MIVRKMLSVKAIYEFTGYHLWWLTGWMSLVAVLYHFTECRLMALPWLPLPLIGTAVAFYVGFKNNQSYDRLWEARKIWSEMTNSSRRLGTLARNTRSGELDVSDSVEVRRQIVFRHIAYIYQLRNQLLEPTPWEHVSLKGIFGLGKINRLRRARLAAIFENELQEAAGREYISEVESDQLKEYQNAAVQLLNLQTETIQKLYERKEITMIQQMQFQTAVNSFYDCQGNLERIKQSPLPRKYATFSFVFVCIFIFLLPFGIVGEFGKMGAAGVWLAIPVGAIIGWIFVAMEMTGDYSENPFEGLHNDTPMLSICREIEINMLQTIGEKDIPRPIQARGDTII
ncbi:hypothetical protein MUK70_11145 [Dyadobacter chenwenxiniae]|uniref:Bestrophin, RFP-TM, chloride channel n=1 Tax=Dyadobacter chenwenxiniae TaxID=2906456 RepID=A0A9X1PSH0_9BACT|nr:bestrophin family ion channel [Dyadobacter chenwenxiniae]MCF0065629.1 hypothetical protein [Dyadobacter chenwenxiniae]UON85540.1 hypothetical protein MUK70_11145 [Dyadobacter chenwenxiniae]